MKKPHGLQIVQPDENIKQNPYSEALQGILEKLRAVSTMTAFICAWTQSDGEDIGYITLPDSPAVFIGMLDMLVTERSNPDGAE
jgi:hypothetical protein